jgi:hypothetical protein
MRNRRRGAHPDQVRRSLRDPEPPRSSRRARTALGCRRAQMIAPPATPTRCAESTCRARHHGEVPATDHDDSYASCQVFAEAERGW